MAIVEMKRMSLLAPQKDEKALLDAMQRLGCVHVSPAEEAEGFERQSAPQALAGVEDALARVGWAIGKLNRFDKAKAPLLGGKPSMTSDEARHLVEKKQSVLMRAVEALEALERESGDLRGQTARIAAAEEQLAPWADFSTPISEVKSTRNTVATLATAQKAALEALTGSGELPSLCVVQVVSTVRDTANLYLVAHRDAADEAVEKLKQAGYAPVTLSGVEGTVRERLAELDGERKRIDERQERIIGEMSAHAAEIGELKALYDALASERERMAASRDLLGSRSTFYLRGWVPANMAGRIEDKLRKISPAACMEFTDPEEGEEPPVLLVNGPVATPYETVVSGFSLPAYNGLDPTAVMMPFFANFMGMMVSDAGYGLLMVLLIPILIKALKPSPGAKRIMWILVGGGVATVIWGALYNTWFGFSPWPSLFNPVEDALPVMGLCVGLGAVHLFAGLGVAAYMNVKRGKPLSAVADQLSWFLLVLGFILLVLPMFVPGISGDITAAGQWMAIAGAGIILVTAGREKSKNPFKRLVSGLGALYGVTSWVSDLLSYMRLFGMGLATGVIGMVFNQLVGMVFAAGPVGWVLGSVLFVFCHLFNMGINVLGAYVHSCRLQYIEFFGKFYEDGGKPFRPLAPASRYCYIQDAPERT